MIKHPLLAEEYSLPEGSYNAECTLKSVWSDKEVMVPDLSESVLYLIQQNISLKIEEEC